MAQTYLTKQNPTAGNRTKGTISMWVKRSGTGSTQYIYSEYLNGTDNGVVYFASGDTLDIISYNGGSAQMHLATNRLFRDVNAWYHLVFAWDTSQGTAADRVKMYINGVQETSFSTATYPSQDANLKFGLGSSYHLYIGRRGDNQDYFNGSMSHVHRVDNQQLNASVFGETDSTTAEWKINTSPSITYTGSSSFNFFILKDGNSLTDQSGQSNDLTLGYGTLTKTEDCPSNVFATCNALATSSYISLTQGNNTVKGNTSTNDGETYSTLGTSNSGKYYWEIKATGVNGGGNPKLGFVQSNRTSVMRLQNGGSGYGGAESGSLDIMTRPNGKVLENGATSSSVLYNTFSAGDILSFALDSDNGAFYYAINGTWQNSGNPASGASRTGAIKTWTPTDAKALGGQHVCIGAYETATQVDCNFGNGYFGTTAVASAGTNASGIGIFEYDVPTGYTALSTKGLNE